jgi:class 3 adenylate cyclase
LPWRVDFAVHCGIGVGDLVGLHVGDYREKEEEEISAESRREFLIIGEPIDQVAKAADDATDGQVLASPQAIQALAFCCNLSQEQFLSRKAVCIASRNESYLAFDEEFDDDASNQLNMMQPYESLRMHCKALNEAALNRLNLQMALYVHPVIRADELALSAMIQAGKITQPTETLESRHRAEAELRSVYTMFISPLISARITGMELVDEGLFKKMNDIFTVTSRELDRYSGHLRQFIVDDKGVVLIATFGLRGSTFPNMVENNCLPATFAIKRALMAELNVDCRIGATFGKVYCGVVGGVRRHEFACMGAPVRYKYHVGCWPYERRHSSSHHFSSIGEPCSAVNGLQGQSGYFGR